MSASAKASARAEDSKILSTEPLSSSDARWTKLVRINYQNPLGKQATWESAERTTRPANAKIDGVGVLALVSPPPSSNNSASAPASASTASSTSPHIVLQKQFRPPVGKVVIEIPAGLLDAGETAATCAVRELHEETGYVGTVDAKDDSGTGNGVMFNDPGFTNTNLQLVHVAVDGSDPRNAAGTRQPALEADEFITTFTVPVRDLWSECRRLEAEGYAVDARVGTLAEGIRLAMDLGLT